MVRAGVYQSLRHPFHFPALLINLVTSHLVTFQWADDGESRFYCCSFSSGLEAASASFCLSYESLFQRFGLCFLFPRYQCLTLSSSRLCLSTFLVCSYVVGKDGRKIQFTSHEKANLLNSNFLKPCMNQNAFIL